MVIIYEDIVQNGDKRACVRAVRVCVVPWAKQKK